MSPELHGELNCRDRTTLTVHFRGFQAIRLSEKFLQICSKQPSFTFFSPSAHLDPTRQAESSEMEQSHRSNCCWHAGLKWDYQCLSTTGHSAPHCWGRGQLLLTSSAGAQFYLFLKCGWLRLTQLSPGIQKKSKTRQTKDNCIGAHFLKIETKKLKIQRHSDLLLCLPNKFFYSFQTEDN